MTPAETQTLVSGAGALGVVLDARTIHRLGCFLDLLGIWTRRLRLTGTRSRTEIIARHVVDCLAPVPHLPARGLVIDLGSGAGFPGIIIAAVRPGTEMALIESRRRAASFLSEAVRTLGLGGVRVVPLRAEQAPGADLRGCGAVVMGRGLRLDRLLTLARPLLAANGVAIAMQTPRTAQHAARVASEAGLRLLRTHDYVLPGVGSRTLVLAVASEEAVS